MSGRERPVMVWHRPEFQGREKELCSIADAAAIAGVSRAAATNWSRRIADFPATVLEIKSSKGQTTRRFLVLAEFETWWDQRRETAPPAQWQKTTRQRLQKGDRLLVERIAVYQKREEVLMERLPRLREALAEDEAELEATRQWLEANRHVLAAIRGLASDIDSVASENEVSSP